MKDTNHAFKHASEEMTHVQLNNDPKVQKDDSQSQESDKDTQNNIELTPEYIHLHLQESGISELSNPNNATLGSDDVHTYTITDNDDAPVVDFNSTSSSGAESSSSKALTVDLSAASGQNVTVSAGALFTAQEIQANFGEFTILRSDTIQSDTSNGSLSIGSQGTGTVQIGQTEFSSSASTITGMVTNGDMSITPNGTGDLKIDAHVNLVVQSGDAAADGTSAHIYAKDESSSAEVFVRDEAGNVTKISPHNTEGDWEYYSKNVKTGKVVRVNMEKMIRKLEEFTGETFIEQ